MSQHQGQGHRRDRDRGGGGRDRGGGGDRGGRRPGAGEDERGAVYIGTTQIYNQLLGAREDLIRTEGKVGQIDKDVTDLQTTVAEQLKAFNDRLTPVERRSWSMPSLAGLIGLGAMVLTIMQMSGVGG